MKEVYLELNRELMGKSQKSPSLKMIENIIKLYEDLVVLYMLGNYRVENRIGIYRMIKRTTTHLYGKDMPPVTTVSPKLFFSKEIKRAVNLNKNLIGSLSDESTGESKEMDFLPEEKFNEIKWDLRSPLRDLK